MPQANPNLRCPRNGKQTSVTAASFVHVCRMTRTDKQSVVASPPTLDHWDALVPGKVLEVVSASPDTGQQAR
ncbi:hypothetical protein NBRC116584_11110 [Hydrogenophaga sp. 5NK40-0174]